MCGVIEVDAGRSRSIYLGRDAYIMIIALDIVMTIRFSINCPIVICSPTMPILMREATSEPYGPGSTFPIILLSDLCFLHSLFSDLQNQKPKNILLHICSFYLCS